MCGTGTVAPTDVTFPVASETTLEQYEGMLVRLPQTMTVTEHFQLGRFGQVTLSQGGRLMQPTNVVAPGAPAAALQAANDLRTIILDDATQAQNPDPIPWARDGAPLTASNTLRGGDTTTGAVGVLTYTWGGSSSSPNAYRIRTIDALDGSVDFVAANEAASCRFMKMITLPKLRDALREMSPVVKVPEAIAERARLPIERMVAIG